VFSGSCFSRWTPPAHSIATETWSQFRGRGAADPVAFAGVGAVVGTGRSRKGADPAVVVVVDEGGYDDSPGDYETEIHHQEM
jgi:hypothetical protein